MATGAGVWLYSADDPVLTLTFFDTQGHIITDIDLADSAPVWDIQVNSQGMVATASEDGTIILWEFME